MEKKDARKRRLAVGAVSVLLCLSGAGVYAIQMVSVKNQFETGIVEIDLKEYTLTEEGEVPWQGVPVVLPGMEVSKIPRIHNSGTDCYVRARLSFKGLKESLENYLYGMDQRWVKGTDGYYYYTEILETGADVDIFQGIAIPDAFCQEEEGKVFWLDIEVDAVQSQNFVPAYDSEMPWGRVEILECRKEGMYDIRSFQKEGEEAFAVRYEGEAGRLFVNQEDFFQNFPTLFPGDEYSDQAVLENKSDTPVHLFFRTETEEEAVLLDRLRLQIRTEAHGKRTLVYDGTVRAEELADTMLLTTIPSGEEQKLLFSLQLPPELDNQYSLTEGQVKWIFSTEAVPEETRPATAVNTGDSGKMGVWLIAAGGALLGVCAGISRSIRGLWKRRTEKK